MNQKAPVPARSISPLAVSDGFIQGWAYDPLRPVLALTLSVDGLASLTGLTGHSVADTFYALATPPNTHCGFCLPLPRLALDGRLHKLLVKVSDWQALPAAPQAEIQWSMGPCFGEVKVDRQGFFEGWVAFRKPVPAKQYPPVVVSDNTGARFAIKPTPEPSRSVDGSQAMATFRVAPGQFADVSNPVFTCLGRELPLKKLPARFKAIGAVEHLDHDGIRGWILNAANPAESLDVQLVIDDQPHLVARPNVMRPGIAREIKLLPEEIGICGFSIGLPRLLRDGRPHTVSIKCKADGTLLNPTPLTYQHLTPGMSLDQARALIQQPAGASSATSPQAAAASSFEGHSRVSGRQPQPESTSLDAGGQRNTSLPDESARTGKTLKSRTSGSSGKDSKSEVLRSPSVRAKAQPAPGMPVATVARLFRKPAKVSAVILNRNGAACLDNLFRSLLQHNTVPLELIVIDHASTDGSLSCVRQWQRHLPIRLEALDDNYSFSASCNRGAQLATAPYVLFLNNDIVWLQDVLPGMLDSLKSPGTGIVGLKLLKSEFEQGQTAAVLPDNPAVQHLGVRFTLIDGQYYPFEENTDTARPDTRYSPQYLPVVTGAVMLCRREQFLAMGGFDEGYVYGYEDVEFCLRMAETTALRSICRNDLVALHHHGYTRLTGREPGMMHHQVNNQLRLGGQLGLWLKRHWWQSLLTGDQLLTAETLTIGFAVHTSVIPDAGNGELSAAVALANALTDLYPHCRTLFLSADDNWNHVSECHVLIALSPEYDLRVLQHARGDLRTAIYLYNAGMAERWVGNPAVALFDLCLYPSTRDIKNAAQNLAPMVPLAAVTATAPLGDLLAPDRLRVLLKTAALPRAWRHVPIKTNGRSSAVQPGPAAESAANSGFTEQLCTALKSQGAIVHVEPAGKTSDDERKVADVVVTVFERAVVNMDRGFYYERHPDVINVLWIVEAADELRPRDIEQADQVWLGTGPLPPALAKAVRQQRTVRPEPKALQGLVRHLLKSVDDKIGRTFYTP